jgi:hypothetical protein
MNWSALIYGPLASALWTSWLAYHHSPLPRTAAIPRADRSLPGGHMASMLTMSGDQYFSPASSNFPALQSAAKSAAISAVVMMISFQMSVRCSRTCANLKLLPSAEMLR